eukprot:scaffold21812_cov110-Isochrysis_galbana.AAC.3
MRRSNDSPRTPFAPALAARAGTSNHFILPPSLALLLLSSKALLNVLFTFQEGLQVEGVDVDLHL